jgi:hypothetical protein
MDFLANDGDYQSTVVKACTYTSAYVLPIDLLDKVNSVIDRRKGFKF